MCGRFIDPDQRAAEAYLRVSKDLGWLKLLENPRYNVAPSQQVVAVTESENGDREGHSMRWGLIPSWGKSRKDGERKHNAKGETVAKLNSYRSSYKKRRCVVPLGGFYEWLPGDSPKQPVFIHNAHGGNLNCAGIWSQWLDEETGELVDSCSILTCPPNSKMADIHNRMPVILETTSAIETWFDISADPVDLIGPCNSGLLAAYLVSKEVNNSRNEGSHLVNQIGDLPEK